MNWLGVEADTVGGRLFEPTIIAGKIAGKIEDAEAEEEAKEEAEVEAEDLEDIRGIGGIAVAVEVDETVLYSWEEDTVLLQSLLWIPRDSWSGEYGSGFKGSLFGSLAIE